MRVRLGDNKRVVVLKHFTHSPKHIAILMQLQVETPLLPIPAEDTTGKACEVPVCELNLSHEELMFLNPAAALPSW